MGAGFFALVFVAVVVPGEQTADGVDAGVAAGIQAYEELDYYRARSILRVALAEESLPDGQRFKALEFLGRVYAVLKEPKLAHQCFVEVLNADPTYEVSWEESPRIREAFAAAKRSVAAVQAALQDSEKPVLAPSPKQPTGAVDLRSVAIESADGEGISSTTAWIVAGATVGAVAAAVAIVLVVVSARGDEPVAGHVGTWRLP